MNNEDLRKNQRRDIDDWNPTESDREVSDEQYLLFPPRVLGYHLSTRIWLELHVESIKEIDQPVSDAQFNKLQLKLDYKKLIKKLVESHTGDHDKKSLMEDFVVGKGKGLVILLHGPPGVGKTLTAECGITSRQAIIFC
jgi:flagellar biosynthesis GTPase FlhF